MTTKTSYLVSIALFILVANAKLKHDLKGQDQLNPVNSSVTYNESNLVNSSELGKFSYLASSLTDEIGIPFQGEFRTGYIIVNTTTQSRYFYWLYSAGGLTNPLATLNDTAPLILWLQGGPGCADGTGQFTEIGPYTIINSSGTLQAVPQVPNWNDEYHLLFIDSPVGVGYSVGTDNVNNATTVAEYVQTFLIRFFQIYTSLAQQSFYVFAESYGGHYGPAVVQKLVSNYTNNGILITGKLL